MGTKIRKWVRQEAVLVISAVCALLSMAVVPPSASTLASIDVRSLILLFCLMAVVAGLQRCGLFVTVAQRLLRGKKPMWQLGLALVMLPFFSSMLITNDVSLITFVPFTILVLEWLDGRRYLIPVVVLQTIAANLGSMATPVGNPQNLFLYSRYQMGAGEFFAALLPFLVVSVVGLAAACFLLRGEGVEIRFPQGNHPVQWRRVSLFAGLFLLCLLAVFRVVSIYLLLSVVVLVVALADRPVFAQVDYCLLLTFVCFFIFAGNMGEIPFVRQVLEKMVARAPMGISVGLSQMISNVPTAVLLSGFTQDGTALLVGTNLGGLGTPVASLASLISLRLYGKTERADSKAYFQWFFAANGIGLAVLLLTAWVLKQL